MHLSQPQKIIELLKQNQGIFFTVMEIANRLIQIYPDEYENKKIKSNKTDEQLIKQLCREIYSCTKKLENAGIRWKDYPKPRKYFYDNNINELSDEKTEDNFHEKDLYAPFKEYLFESFGLEAARINESASKNNKGKNGNRWLHPDIVAMEPLLDNWQKETVDCFRESYNSGARLWSFEIKRELTSANVRESFFQAVSNSTWANEGYLVATDIDNEAENELRMLSALHGIGIIIFNKDDFSKSELLIPARKRPNVDWQTIDRLVAQNDDFRKFISYVSIYLSKRYHFIK